MCRWHSIAAIFAQAAHFRSRNGNLNPEIVGNLRLQILIKLRLKLAHFAAAHARHVNVVARPMALIIVSMSAQVQQIELIDQSMALQQIHGPIHGHAGNIRIDLLRALQNFLGVHVSWRAFEHLDEHHPLTCQPDAARPDLLCQMPGRLVLIDALTSRRATQKGEL